VTKRRGQKKGETSAAATTLRRSQKQNWTEKDIWWKPAHIKRKKKKRTAGASQGFTAKVNQQGQKASHQETRIKLSVKEPHIGKADVKNLTQKPWKGKQKITP